MTNRAAAVWAAMRAVMEGAAVTPARMAQVSGKKERTIRQKAEKNGWKLTGAASGLTRGERIGRLHDRLLDRIERNQLSSEADESIIDKAGVAELTAAVRTLSKISEVTHDEDSEKERQMERDADIASILDRLDRKIVELAHHLAETMVAGGILDAGAHKSER